MRKTAARLGQHFLANAHYAKILVDAAALREGETALEIGPGKGMLTRELLRTGAHVVAVEKDEALAAFLRGEFAGEIAAGQFDIRTMDVRDATPEALGLSAGKYVVAANIPYYITGEILRQFLSTRAQPRAMALLVQKEVAERIVARDGKESILSLSVKAYGTPRIAAKVSRGNFSPPPSVDSAIIAIEAISREAFGTLADEAFFAAVKAGFASKRKLLSNNLAVKFGKERTLAAIEEAGVEKDARAEDVPLEKWFALAKSLAE